MKLEINNIEQFKNFFDVVYDASNEIVELKFFIDRMTCAVLDRARTRFFYVEYESKFFSLYDVGEVSSVCVFIEDIYKLLKLANKTDTLILEFSNDAMAAQLISDGNKRIFEFGLPLDFVESPNFPQASLKANIELTTKELKQSVKDISLVGTDIFQFVISKDNITLMSDSSLSTSEFSSVKYAQVIEVPTDVDETLTVRFNVDYIAQMLKFDKIGKEISLELDERALFYKIEDEIMGVSVRGMVAPRIVEEV